MSIKVSVIIPIYNAEKYLRQCLDSVLNQTFCDFEIVAVNDGSKDTSGEILKEYAEKYPEKITALFQENKGQSAARNRAIKASHGEYLMFVDSDDFIGRNYIEHFYNSLIENDSEMVIGSYTKTREDGTVISENNANFIENGLRIPSYISCNRIVRKELLTRYDIHYQEGTICEDIPFNLYLEATAENIQIIDEYKYYYRTNPASTTMAFSKRKLTMEQLPFEELKRCVDFCRKQGTIDEKVLEFYISRILTSLIFELGAGCTEETLDQICDQSEMFLKEYFPDYYKNPYVRLNAFKNLTSAQKYGVWLFVHMCHIHMLKPFAHTYASVVRRGK